MKKTNVGVAAHGDLCKRKNNKGITLIALIITIIVLLILAVVAIGAVQNDGIIEHAKNARDQYGAAGAKENTTLGEYLDKIEGHLPGNDGNGESTTKSAYKIGDVVAIGTEQFYVIKDSPETENTVTLLAYGAIDTANNVQGALTGVDFGTAITAAANYGEKLGGVGRLLTDDEANVINSTEYNAIILYENPSFHGIYWLENTGDEWNGTVVYSGRTGRVESSENNMNVNGNNPWLRPVIEIGKDKINNDYNDCLRCSRTGLANFTGYLCSECGEISRTLVMEHLYTSWECNGNAGCGVSGTIYPEDKEDLSAGCPTCGGAIKFSNSCYKYILECEHFTENYPSGELCSEDCPDCDIVYVAP